MFPQATIHALFRKLFSAVPVAITHSSKCEKGRGKVELDAQHKIAPNHSDRDREGKYQIRTSILSRAKGVLCNNPKSQIAYFDSDPPDYKSYAYTGNTMNANPYDLSVPRYHGGGAGEHSSSFPSPLPSGIPSSASHLAIGISPSSSSSTFSSADGPTTTFNTSGVPYRPGHPALVSGIRAISVMNDNTVALGAATPAPSLSGSYMQSMSSSSMYQHDGHVSFSHEEVAMLIPAARVKPSSWYGSMRGLRIGKREWLRREDGLAIPKGTTTTPPSKIAALTTPSPSDAFIQIDSFLGHVTHVYDTSRSPPPISHKPAEANASRLRVSTIAHRYLYFLRLLLVKRARDMGLRILGPKCEEGDISRWQRRHGRVDADGSYDGPWRGSEDGNKMEGRVYELFEKISWLRELVEDDITALGGMFTEEYACPMFLTAKDRGRSESEVILAELQIEILELSMAMKIAGVHRGMGKGGAKGGAHGRKFMYKKLNDAARKVIQMIR